MFEDAHGFQWAIRSGHTDLICSLNILDEKEVIIHDLQTTLEERKTIIRDLKQTVDEREDHINELTRLGEEHLLLMKDLKSIADEREKHIDQLSRTAEKHLQLIQELKTIANERDLSLTEKEQVIRELDTVARERSRLILELDQANQDRQERINQLQWKWNNVKTLGFLWISAWGRRMRTPQLGILHQYPPRPMHVPAWYIRQSPLASPPVISLVTPSYNQAEYLEQTIQSVMEQNYPRLEYIIQDGGSGDGSIAILEKYRSFCKHCESRKDEGQTQAINLGFQHASGEIMAWLNSDDLLLPGTLHYVAAFFQAHPDVDVIYSHRVLIDPRGREVGRWIMPPHDADVLTWADYVPQETLFWRRRIWEKAGDRLDEDFHFAMDWDMLLRFQEAGARFVRVPRFLGAFRVHAKQKTSANLTDLGHREMKKLRDRCHQRTVTDDEITRHLRPYIRRHMLLQNLYELGLIRY